jgi:hypothetical protein
MFMKTLSLLAILFFAAGSVFAQHTLQLDNGSGSYITVLPPIGLANGSVYYLPQPPNNSSASGFVAIGTAAGQLPIWNTSTSSYNPLSTGTNNQVLTMSGGTPTWQGPSVGSVFGRTGSIVASANDYNFSQIAGTAGITQGGTGQITANGALNALLPAQALNGGKMLQTDGTNTTWQNLSVTGANFPVTDGHYQSKQTLIVTGAALPASGTGAVLNALTGCTDVAGKITMTSGNAALAAGDQVKISFINHYGVAPVVVIVGGNAATAGHVPYVSAVTANDFTIGYSNAPGNTEAQVLYYYVIETQ